MKNTARKMTLSAFYAAGIVLGTGLVSASATAATLYSQGFETDTAGWTAGGSYGTIERRADGTNGISAFAGGHYANVTETDAGPYTFWGGAETGPVGFSSSVATYFDIGNWAAGSGFDYSVAASNQSGTHLRDFVFHIFKNDVGSVVVGGSNNTNFMPMDRSGSNHTDVTESGWYILQHVFYEDGGVLAVDLNLRAEDGSLLFTETRSDPSDDFSSVYGGNYYGWFTDVSFDEGLNIDAVSLQADSAQAVPEPRFLGLMAIVLIGLGFGYRRKMVV